MREIILTKGKVAIVDDIDFDEVSRHKWHCGDGYASRSIRDNNGMLSTEYMHRVIIGANSGEYVDHIDGNKLNNKQENLRICTQSQNIANNHNSPRAISGFWGVTRHRKGWAARIMVNYRLIYLGTFPSPEEAACARDEASIKYFGKFAPLNFSNKLVNLDGKT